jgi:hypothetical protein
MGLDQYAYVSHRAGHLDEFYASADHLITATEGHAEYANPQVERPREIACWRKHPNLQGWMEQLWRRKMAFEPSADPVFNGVELELTWDDLDELEQAVTSAALPETEGFFFGRNADDHYREQDLRFIQQARADLFMGLRVFYNSSW